MKNEVIDRICFASLVVDHEYPPMDDCPAFVVCRVLVDGNWRANLYAETREEAIAKFRRREWDAK